jgi:TRAP-type C4-dicarboxylate transport system permease small subunit
MKRSFAQRCVAALEWTLDATGAAFGLVTGALIVLMAVEIAIRFFGIGSLSWLIEIAEYTLCGGTFLAAPWVLRCGGHVRIDILVTALPRRIGKRLEQFCDLLGCGISFPYTVLSLSVLLLIVAVPWLATWLPKLIN